MKEEELNTWSDTDELICPYCGYHYKIDHTEFALGGDELEFDDRKFECPNCEEEYLVMRRVSFTYETYKKKRIKINIISPPRLACSTTKYSGLIKITDLKEAVKYCEKEFEKGNEQ